MLGDHKLTIVALEDAHSTVRFTQAFAREMMRDAAAGGKRRSEYRSFELSEA